MEVQIRPVALPEGFFTKSTPPPSLKPGDLVRLSGGFMNLAPVRAKFRYQDRDLLHFSIGEADLGMTACSVAVEKINEPEPVSWLEDEVSYLRDSVKRCQCEDCRLLLKEKESELLRMRGQCIQ